jgi:hypothetical protein
VLDSGASILDALAAGTSPTLSAPTVQLTAATGIGSSAAPVRVATTSLSAASATGSIQISNTPTGGVTLTHLTTGGLSDILYAQNGQTLYIAGNVTSNGGNILIDPPTSVSMSPSSVVASAGGNVTIQSAGNIMLSTVNAAGATPNSVGNVSLQSTGGNIASVTPATGNTASGTAGPGTNVTANVLTLAAPGNVQLAYAAQLVDAKQVLGLVSSASGVLPTFTPAPTTTLAAAQVAATTVQSVLPTLSAISVPPPPLTEPTLVFDPTTVVEPTVVLDATSFGAVATSSEPTAVTGLPVVDPLTGTVIQNTTPSAASGSPADLVSKVVVALINVGNSVIQKPVDQIIITDKPRAQSLVCR